MNRRNASRFLKVIDKKDGFLFARALLGKWRWCGVPVLHHEVAGQEQLVPGDVLDGDVVEKPYKAND
jgi:hypothetical protein